METLQHLQLQVVVVQVLNQDVHTVVIHVYVYCVALLVRQGTAMDLRVQVADYQIVI